MSLIRIRGVSKTYGNGVEQAIALENITLEITRSEFVAIVGPSGSGKTTLLSILGGMNAPTDGEVIIDGTSLYALSGDQLADFRSQRLGFVFQQLCLVPYLTALENVMLPLVICAGRGAPPDAARSMLREFGLEGKCHRLPGQMSSGEQARVAIARALVKAPPIILADEPTGNLDSVTGREIMGTLEAANRRGHTVIIVTHNQEIASAAQRIIRLQDGRVAANG